MRLHFACVRNGARFVTLSRVHSVRYSGLIESPRVVSTIRGMRRRDSFLFIVARRLQ